MEFDNAPNEKYVRSKRSDYNESLKGYKSFNLAVRPRVQWGLDIIQDHHFQT